MLIHVIIIINLCIMIEKGGISFLNIIIINRKKYEIQHFELFSKSK